MTRTGVALMIWGGGLLLFGALIRQASSPPEPEINPSHDRFLAARGRAFWRTVPFLLGGGVLLLTIGLIIVVADAVR